MQGGERVSGPVIGRTEREVLLAWGEASGALRLKCFKMGPTRAVCVEVNSWASEPWDAARRAAVQSALDSSLERLLAGLSAPARSAQ